MALRYRNCEINHRIRFFIVDLALIESDVNIYIYITFLKIVSIDFLKIKIFIII